MYKMSEIKLTQVKVSSAKFDKAIAIFMKSIYDFKIFCMDSTNVKQFYRREKLTFKDFHYKLQKVFTLQRNPELRKEEKEVSRESGKNP